MTIPKAPCLIEMHVEDPNGLFERLDASPLATRHLEQRVEQFVVHRAQEMPCADFTLAVKYRSANPPLDAAALSEALRAYFAHRSQEESAKVSAQIQEAGRDLLIGVLFLLSCAVLALGVSKLLPASLGLFAEQGLLIIGWVALWRPIDLFLYELRPMRSRRALFTALSRMNIRFDQAA